MIRHMAVMLLVLIAGLVCGYYLSRTKPWGEINITSDTLFAIASVLAPILIFLTGLFLGGQIGSKTGN